VNTHCFTNLPLSSEPLFYNKLTDSNPNNSLSFVKSLFLSIFQHKSTNPSNRAISFVSKYTACFTFIGQDQITSHAACALFCLVLF